MNSSKATITPLFCVETIDKKSSCRFVINFQANDEVQSPIIDIEEKNLVREICKPSPEIENYKIPLQLTQIYWSKREDTSDKSVKHRFYVIDVQINDKFAFRKVLSSEIIRHYLITVSMVTIENKYNSRDASKSTGQLLGHNLDLDQAEYEIVKSKVQIERSDEVVTNKVVIVSETGTTQNLKKSADVKNVGEEELISYDLYFRPKSMLLTCSISTDRLPDKISFNDDRIFIQSAEQTLLDACLPLNIDLSVPMRYKFDDRFNLLRIVFKLEEPALFEYDTSAGDDGCC